YRTVDFDSKHRFFFDIAYPPEDKNCLACHSVSPAKDARANSPVDVHTARGIKCAECHRNGLGHDITRGYENEAAETADRPAESFTCRGCHLGTDATGKRLVMPGRLGAPYPKHTGIPLVHFRRLECTVCHSGPVQDGGWTRVRTSRANRLGVYGVAQWSTDQPAVMEPVFMRDGGGKIGPRRLVWPAFWARLEAKSVVPLQPGAVETAAGETLKCEDRIASVLAALAQACGEGEVAVLGTRGWLFEVNVDGGLDAAAMVAPEEGGAAKGSHFFWGTKKDGAIVPLVPDFDPAAQDKDPAAETRLQAVVEALATVAGAPGPPAAVVRRTLYRMEEGNLSATEAPAELAGAAGAGWLVGGRLVPLASDFDIRTIEAKAGTERTLTEEQVGLVLKALAASEAGGKGDVSRIAYFSNGRSFRLNRDGRLISEDAAAAAPVTWPLAHNVRPVQQSLGWKGCTDCHTADSKFFFKTLRATGPLLTDGKASRSATSLMRVGSLFHRVFGLTFAFRPFFKLVLAVSVIATGAVLAVFLVVVAGKLAGLIEKRS
ncbi:MAG TPA: multiheme c-type cytochrome, partial [Terriglobales bacterium]|nr:multiheme c-type cytochrome [Terriglobales bacterium]